MKEARSSTPAADGFRMPAEWEPHAMCLMAWPCRRELWRDRLAEARDEYAGVARAIGDFERVLVIANPGDADDIRNRCGSGVDVFELPIDDSWIRDNGPVFVRDARGSLAVVAFGFNAWGDRWHPYDDDARVPERIAAHLGLPLYRAPFVLEGGAFMVDGEGTVVTTEQCLLSPNRNPGLDRSAIEAGLRDYLGASTVVWLPYGPQPRYRPRGHGRPRGRRRRVRLARTRAARGPGGPPGDRACDRARERGCTGRRA